MVLSVKPGDWTAAGGVRHHRGMGYIRDTFLSHLAQWLLETPEERQRGEEVWRTTTISK